MSDASVDLRNPLTILGLVSAQSGAVYEVTATEVELSSDEVLEGLRSGAIRATDLVQLGEAWRPLSDVMEFSAAVEHRARVDSRWRFVKGAVFLAVGILGAVLVGWLQLWVRMKLERI